MGVFIHCLRVFVSLSVTLDFTLRSTQARERGHLTIVRELRENAARISETSPAHGQKVQ